LARFLYLNPKHNADVDVVDRAIAVENKWRAQRYGVQGTFVTRSGAVTVASLLDRVVELTAAETEAFGCRENLEHCRAIVLEGSSADAQLRVFAENQRDGQAAALHKVTRWIRDATLLA
jgi:glutamate---cysteine ligase / carboxylate-amine ligase